MPADFVETKQTFGVDYIIPKGLKQRLDGGGKMEDCSQVDRYLNESSRRFRQCQVNNTARRHSLMKRTLGIEVERRVLAAERTREEKQLREQLRGMQIDRAKTTLNVSVKVTRGSSKSRNKRTADDSEKRIIPVSDFDPYPVTFGTTLSPPRPRAGTMGEKCQKYAIRRGRRQSHEFEDLHMNTATGKLTLPRLQMLAARGCRSGTPSPYSLSPSPSRRNVDLGSESDSYWAGDPEAIRSVRRPRKSVEEQGKDRAMLRSQVAEARLKEGP